MSLSKKEKTGIGVVAGVGALVAIALVARAAPPPEPEPGKANFYGRVFDAETEQPVKDVVVSLDGMEDVTDSGGNYRFTDLTPGPYSGIASKSGYETYYF